MVQSNKDLVNSFILKSVFILILVAHPNLLEFSNIFLIKILHRHRHFHKILSVVVLTMQLVNCCSSNKITTNKALSFISNERVENNFPVLNAVIFKISWLHENFSKMHKKSHLILKISTYTFYILLHSFSFNVRTNFYETYQPYQILRGLSKITLIKITLYT